MTTTQSEGTAVLVAGAQGTVLQSNAATIAELKAACPGAPAEFLMAQLEATASVNQAQVAWMHKQREQLEAKDRELAELKTKTAGGSSPKKPGVQAAGGFDPKRRSVLDEEHELQAEAYTGDPKADFSAAVRSEMARGVERRAAVIAVAKRDPQLHQAYLLATNPNKRRVRELIADRFETE